MSVPSVKNLSTLVRPRFGPGMLLHHEDLEQLTDYTRELSRLMFRSFFGCGVVCGLVVTPENDCGQASITVGAGLALNCSGDPIYVPKEQTIVINPNCDPNPESPLWVLLCRTTKCCAPRTSMCASDEDDFSSTCTRDREVFEIRVVTEEPKCSCRCEIPDPAPAHKDDDCWCVDPTLDCYKAHYQGECGCQCGECIGGGCDCVLLARLDKPADVIDPWSVDHRVRRFIRPVLVRDPQVEKEYQQRQALLAAKSGGKKTAKEKKASSATPAAPAVAPASPPNP
jgi:hypothetical protein